MSGGALPKPQQTLQRVTFKTSRLAEFCGRRECGGSGFLDNGIS
jgi:hypothetical protein